MIPFTSFPLLEDRLGITCLLVTEQHNVTATTKKNMEGNIYISARETESESLKG